MSDRHAAILRRTESRLRALDPLTAATLRAIRGDLEERMRGVSGRDTIRFAIDLLDTRAPGAHVIAYELVQYHPQALDAIRATDLRRLGKHMASWGEVDTFACAVAGRAWRARRVEDRVIHGWAASSDRWWRRAALVSTVPLNVKAQGGTGDARRTLAVCRLLIDDRDEMVVKALSWALRALAVREPVAVTSFLETHRDRLAPRVLREVRNKLGTGRKSGRV